MKLVSRDEAKIILESGDVVAIPTETVYGLAGWIHSEEGLKKIFSTKERPFFDPLIVHISGIEDAKKLTSNWTLAHEALAQAFWPGPLTLIAKKNELVHPLITSGLDSVGLRCPNHPETLSLLSHISGGLAAPSANKFGKTSPTKAQHVFEEFGESVAIIDGGSSKVGIESTVAGITEKDGMYQIQIFRPGQLTASELKKVLDQQQLKNTVEYAKSPVAPGQLEHHYMPKIPLIIVPITFEWDKNKELIEKKLQKNFLCPKFWSLSKDATLASRELYEEMRTFDQQGFDLILVTKETIHHSESWLGIWNRLQKAKSLEITEKDLSF